MSVFNLHYPRPTPKPGAVLVIALAGATGSGKSTFAQWSAQRCSLGKVISFADPLRESAKAAGWIPELKHTPEQRAFIQRHSQEQKEKYGEDMYARAVMERIGNEASPSDTYFIDDLRHFVEINTLLASESENLTVFPLHFFNHEAEMRWMHAVMAPRTKETEWAHHRSELEWRSYRNSFESFKNIRNTGAQTDDEIAEALGDSLHRFARFLRRNCDHFIDVEHLRERESQRSTLQFSKAQSTGLFCHEFDSQSTKAIQPQSINP